MTEPTKRAWIKAIAARRTFADIGGLGGSAINEMVTTALESGAAEATMVDVVPLGNSLWRDFDLRCQQRGVSGYRCLQADLDDPAGIGPWDVVHCSGIIYHAADPVRMMLALRPLCSEYLIFTSMVVPPVIDNSAGRLDLTGGRAVFIPAIDAQAKAICAEHFGAMGIRVFGINDDAQFSWLTPERKVDYGPWWWLFPEEYIERLLTLAGFQVLVKEETWPGRAVSFLCLKT
ncbi:MAG: hypothetical protein ABJC09_15045 [Terriglobia bacterium]